MEMIIRKRKRKLSFNVSAILMCGFLVFYCATLLTIYLWGFFTSLKEIPDEFMKNVVSLPWGWPWEWHWENYKQAFDAFQARFIHNGAAYTVNFVGMFVNTVIFSLLSAVISTTTVWLMSYLIAMFPGKVSNFLYALNLVLMMIPLYGTLPSALAFEKGIGIYNTWWHVIFNAISFTGGGIIVFVAMIKAVGTDVKEAALIDGANNLAVMLYIVFPMTINMYMITFIGSIMAGWNDYMTMIVWMPSYPNLAYGVYQFSVSTETGLSWPPIQCAGAMLIMLPILIYYIFNVDKILGEITISTSK